MPTYRVGANLYAVVALWGEQTGGAVNTAGTSYGAQVPWLPLFKPEVEDPLLRAGKHGDVQTGVLTASLPSLTASMSGDVRVDGVLVVTLPGLVADLDGDVVVDGTLVMTLPALSSHFDGDVVVDGVLLVVLPTLTSDFDGSSTVEGFLVTTLPGLVADLDGGSTVGGVLAATLPSLASDFDGDVVVDGILTAVLPGLASDLDGDVIVGGALNAVLPGLSADLDGRVVVTDGVLNSQLPGLVADLDGALVVDGVLNGMLPALVFDADGLVEEEPPPGDGGLLVTLPALGLSMVGSLTVAGTLNAILPDMASDLEEGLQVAIQTGPCNWPLNELCCSDWASYSAPVRSHAESMAKAILWALTGRQYGACDIVVRPCRASCSVGTPPNGWWSGSTWTPHIDGGVWVNTCTCNSAGACSCGPLCEVRLPGPVSAITEVKVDGVVVPPTSYVVYGWRDLVRTDGECWPVCQDYALAATEVGSFQVSYSRGIPVPDEGATIAGVLACEIAKSCIGAACRLAKHVTSITRQGTTSSFISPEQLAKLRLTGVPEVDLWVTTINPARLESDSQVWSPDLRLGGRVQTS